MIVTVLGGSAPSTPWLVDWLAHAAPHLPITIRLAGRERRRVTAVARASRLLAAHSSIRVEDFAETEWPDALAGAHVVLIQVRVGGLAAREQDESVPPRFGIPGDEGLGPGGLAAAIRTWPVLREILTLVYRYAPNCLPLLLTSPAGLLIRAAAAVFPGRALSAICELPFTTLAQIAAMVGRAPGDLELSYAGVNHLGWLYDAEGAIAQSFSRLSAETWARVAARRYGAIPLKYLRLHFEREAVADEQRRAGAHNSRAVELMRIAAHSLAAFENGDRDAIGEALAARPAPWYSEAIGPLLLQSASAEGRQRPYFLTRAEADGEVRERSYFLEYGELVPESGLPPPAAVREFLKTFIAYERRALPCVLNPSIDALEAALASHPWVGATALAEELAGEIWQRSGNEAEKACESYA